MSRRDGDMLVNQPRERILRGEADAALHFVAFIEQNQSWDASHAVTRRHRRVLVDVQFHNPGATFVLLGEGVDRRRERQTWATPRRPEIDQHRLIRLQNLRLETVVRHFSYSFTHAISSLTIYK